MCVEVLSSNTVVLKWSYTFNEAFNNQTTYICFPNKVTELNVLSELGDVENDINIFYHTEQLLKLDITVPNIASHEPKLQCGR